MHENENNNAGAAYIYDEFSDIAPILDDQDDADENDMWVESTDIVHNLPVNIVLYKRRWFMLFLFSLNCVGNAINFSSIAAINDIACAYYQVTPETLNWVPNSFLLIYAVVGLPSAYLINILGLRRSLIIGSSLNAITCCLHFAGSGRDGFLFVMAGNVCAALAVGAVLQVPAKLATVWFGADEHATATAVGYLVNILGMALGFVQSTQMVPDTRKDLTPVADGMYAMNLSQMVYVLVTLVLTYACFKSKPPSPPSDLVTSVHEGENILPFRTCLKILLKDRDFNLYAQAYGIMFAAFCALATVLDEMVCSKIPDSTIGWMGFSCNILGIIGMLGCGMIVDRYKCYKAMSVFLVVGGLLDWVAFTIVFLYTDWTSVMFIMYSLFGFFAIPLQSVGVEQGSVTTYPVPEEISAGIMLVLGNLYGFVMVLCFGQWIADGRSTFVCYVTIALLLVASVCVCWSKVVVKKMHGGNARESSFRGFLRFLSMDENSRWKNEEAQPSDADTTTVSRDEDNNIWVKNSDIVHNLPVNIVLYKRRWFMLFLFSLNCVGNAINFSSIAAINDIACAYYQVTPETLNWVPNSFLLIYAIVGLPSAYLINILGLRRSLIIGSSLNAITCCLHFAGSGRDGFFFVMVGNVCAALAVGAVLQVPAKLATVWFGADEHATATAIGYLVNILGMALGFVQSTQMVPDTRKDFAPVAHGMYAMNLSQMVYVLVTLVLTYACFKSKPPSPPSDLVTSVHEGENILPFRTCLKILLKDRDFNLYAQAYGIMFAAFCALATNLDEMVCSKIPDSTIGWMGFSCNILGIIGMLSCGMVVDRYKCYKAMSVFLVVGGLLDWVAFTVVFLYTDWTSVMFILYSLFGFFAIPLQSVGVEQGSVTTYPVPEEISAGVMLVLGNLYGFVMVLCFGQWIADGRSTFVCYVTIALLLVASVCVCWSKVVVKKMHRGNARESSFRGFLRFLSMDENSRWKNEEAQPSDADTTTVSRDEDNNIWVKNTDIVHNLPVNIVLYKRRWFMLFLFSLNCVGNAINFSSIAAINDIACAYYQVTPETLNWVPNSFLLIYAVVGLPSAYLINILGLRRSLIIGSSLNAITCCLHFAGSGRDGFFFVMVGNVCAALAVGAVLQVPAKLATVWFGADEHATATAVGYLVNILGMALGFVQSTQMVPDTRKDLTPVADGMYAMNLSQMVYVLVTLVLTYACFKSKPPSPPSDLVTSVHEGENILPFRTCLKILLKDRDFNLYAQAYGIMFAAFCALATILDEMVCSKIPDSTIGWMGFSCNILGIIGMLGCGMVVDRYKCYKAMSVFLVVGGLLDWVAFTVVFLYTDWTSVMFILYSLFGFFAIPLQSVGVEQGSVTTYPVPEEISAGVMLVLGNLYGFVMVLCFGQWIADGRSTFVCYVTIALLLVASVCVCWSKVVVKKIHGESVSETLSRKDKRMNTM